MSEHRILIVEDQEDLAALYKATLAQAGYCPVNAYTGEEGVAEFQASGADVVLLDMTLPEMQGLRVLQEIRAMSAGVPVIVATAASRAGERAQCEALGVLEYLIKPFDDGVLLAAVARAVTYPPEEYQVVTLRLPARTIAQLSRIDPNLARAITVLCEEMSG